MTVCLILDRLPPELRLEIYEYALRYDGVLYRPSLGDRGKQIENGVLRACRQVHDEATDVFYNLNAFRVDYLRICNCFRTLPDSDQSDLERYKRARRCRVPAFDVERICKLRITSFDPWADVQTGCATCQRSGLGLVELLIGLPKLCKATIEFEFVDDFIQFMSQLEKHATWGLIGLEIGMLSLVGVSTDIRLSIPALTRAWRCLAGFEDTTPTRYLSEETTRQVLEYLCFECNVSGRVSTSLRPFFDSDENTGIAQLRLKSAIDGDKRLAYFSVALAGVLRDIFVEDGGSETIEWVHVDGFAKQVRWVYEEGCALPSNPKSRLEKPDPSRCNQDR